MPTEEIVLALTEPESEWIRGRAVRKMSPTRSHARVQLAFAAALETWAGDRGQVGTEWRFRIVLAGEARRPLVPDIAFVTADALRGLSFDESEAPAFAPTVAIEILSRGDDALDVASKVDVYLRGGSALVIVIDPIDRTVTLHDTGSSRFLTGDDDLQHPVLPGFALPLGSFFAAALRLPE